VVFDHRFHLLKIQNRCRHWFSLTHFQECAHNFCWTPIRSK